MTSALPFCADMTELIAADSWLNRTEVGHHDPRAEAIFDSVVSTLCCKSAVLYFERPRYLPESPGLLLQRWAKINSDQKERGITLDPKALPPQSHLDKEERWSVMSAAFDEALEKQDGLLNNLVSFTQFQMSSPTIMDIFWGLDENPNNSVDALRESLQRISGSARQRMCDRLCASTIPLDDRTRQKLDSAKIAWADAQVAYPFWAFVKGFQYAAKMPDDHIHLLHWLRERAWPAGAQTTEQREQQSRQLARLFPWGPAIGVLVAKGVIRRTDEKRLCTLIKELRSAEEPLAGYTDLIGDGEEREKRIAEAVMCVRESAEKELSARLGEAELRKFNLESLIDVLTVAAVESLAPEGSRFSLRLALAVGAIPAKWCMVTLVRAALPPQWFRVSDRPVVKNFQIWSTRLSQRIRLKDERFTNAAEEYVRALNRGRVIG